MENRKVYLDKHTNLLQLEEHMYPLVEAKAADNASVTILPTFNNIKKIIVESEDHNTRNVFEIRLGEETEETPESGDRDYPIRRLTAFAESEYNGSGTEGPAEYVLDHIHTLH